MEHSLLKRKNNEPSFPLRWLTAIMIFEMLMIGANVWLIGYTEVRVSEGMKRQVRLERLHGDIVHLDEVLTMSAKMAAASGDAQWEQRYLRFEPLLDDKIREVMAEAEVLELDLAELGIATTNEANSRLVAMEKESFREVREKNSQAARILLASEAYNQNKAQYAKGLDKLLTRLDRLVTSLVESQRSRVQAAQITSLMGWILLIAIWVVLLKGITRWRSTLLKTQNELSVYQTQLEARVFSMAKQLTRAEHRERQRIAGLLHDQMQQLLVAARLQLGLLPESSYRGQVNDMLEQSIKLSRSLTNELNPPGLMVGGLADALKWLTEWVKNTHGLEIKLTIAGSLPPVDTETKVIALDSVREVLFNIVKHAEVGHAEVSAAASDSGGVKIEVLDRGVGFNEDVVWSGERFGLLNTIRRLELIGGGLEFQTKVGQGCHAALYLPKQDESAVVGHEGKLEFTPRRKVLIVDDHPVVRAGLVSALRRVPGTELQEAAGMADVVEALNDFIPDVAIVDISLGEGEPDGCDVTEFLRDRLDRIKVVAFTSYEDQHTRSKMREAGANQYLVKGCSTSDLIEAISA